MAQLTATERPKVSLSFHGGTLVVAGNWPGLELGTLPGVGWDARVHAWRAPGADYGRIVEALRAVGARGRNAVVESLRDNQPLPYPSRDLQLRPHQHEAVAAWLRADERGVVVAPTGSGKTRLAIAGVRLRPRATLVVVPTRVLLQQWARELENWLGQPIARLGDGLEEVGPITVTTIESAYRRMGDIGDRFELLIVDEAHHFGRGQRDEALEMCVAPARLSLTATPPTDELQLERVQQLLGPICSQTSIDELVGSQVLSPYRIETLHLPLSERERAAYQREYVVFAREYSSFMRRFPNASWQQFRLAALKTDQGRAALSAWLKARRIAAYTAAKQHAVAELLARHQGSKCLVFTSENQVAYDVAAGHLVMPFTCDIGRKERERTLDRFRRGELRCLVSSRVLNEGLDVPDAEVGIIVAGAHGQREHVQRIGRLLRPRPGKTAQIYELVSIGTAEARAPRHQLGAAA